MDLSYQRRLAAEILGVGESRIRFEPTQLDKIAGAVTKDEVRRLIRDGAIYVEPLKSNSRGRWREFHEARKSGRHRGPGRRRGTRGARVNEERLWTHKVRKMRRFLKALRDKEVIDRKTYRMLYMKVKGGAFESLTALKRYMKDHGLLPKEYA